MKPDYEKTGLTIRFTAGQREKMRRLGGPDWLRNLIDTAPEKPYTGPSQHAATARNRQMATDSRNLVAVSRAYGLGVQYARSIIKRERALTKESHAQNSNT